MNQVLSNWRETMRRQSRNNDDFKKRQHHQSNDNDDKSTTANNHHGRKNATADKSNREMKEHEQLKHCEEHISRPFDLTH